MSKLSTESYKGVRDFYPEDQFIQNHIFSIMRKTVESFGFLEYGASILEPAELYRAKSGEEIVNNETYTFKDRGDREVTLRPEMTPTVARMVAAKQKELSFPLRWYSIPNLFRYERPQKGRLREHYQLNVDIFGIENIWADIELINIAHKIMLNFGAKETDFVILINNRKVLKDLFQKFDINEEAEYKLSKLIDKKEKISKDDFLKELQILIGDRADELTKILESTEELINFLGKNNPNVSKLLSVMERLSSLGIQNIKFSPTLMRGFDYYTEIVFEVFDLDPENNRSLFGGGRYDDLLDIFGKEKVPAFGFGMGDVTARDFLETHNLLPEYKPKTDLYICVLKEEFITNAYKLADKLKEKNLFVLVDITGKKVGDQIKYANKNNIPFVVCIGEDEVKNEKYKLKELNTGKEKEVDLEGIVNLILK